MADEVEVVLARARKWVPEGARQATVYGPGRVTIPRAMAEGLVKAGKLDAAVLGEEKSGEGNERLTAAVLTIGERYGLTDLATNVNQEGAINLSVLTDLLVAVATAEAITGVGGASAPSAPQADTDALDVVASGSDGTSEELPADFPHRDLLMSARFTTRAAVARASDEELLAIDGVGPATLAKIRSA